MTEPWFAIAVCLLVAAELALAKQAVRIGTIAVEIRCNLGLPTQLAGLQIHKKRKYSELLPLNNAFSHAYVVVVVITMDGTPLEA